jgi:pimeloyl-ACP methyl ester carboxylesterase
MSHCSVYKTVAGERAVKKHYRSILARWPVPLRILEAETRYGRTSILSCGAQDGRPLVLLHGAASNSLAWMADVDQLARHHKVFAVDVIGDAGLSAAARPPWKGPAYSDWLSDVFDGLGLKTVRLLGLSQGGWIALKFATSWPERVEKLVLLSPGGVVRTRLTFLLRALPLLAMGKPGVRRLNRIVASPQELHPEALIFVDLIMAHLRPRTDVAPLFSDEELRRLAMPVLLVGGERDAIHDTRAIAARLQKLLPSVQTRLLGNTGHALVNTAPLVVPFLEASGNS